MRRERIGRGAIRMGKFACSLREGGGRSADRLGDVNRRRPEEIDGVGGQEAKKVRDYSEFGSRSASFLGAR